MNIFIENTQKAEIFSIIFQHMKVFSEHINILFEPERLYIQSMDSARVMIFEITLPARWFDKYECQASNNIGISSQILFKILNTRDRMHHIRITSNTANDDHLNIHFTSEDKNCYDKFFEVPLIDLESETMSIPETDYQAEFTLSSGYFSALINQLKVFGDTMDIECSEEKIVLFSKSPDNGKMSVEINIDDLSAFAINEGEKLELSFSLQCLSNICLYNKLSKEIEIKVSPDYPIKIAYYLGGDEDAKMMFYLAPKVSSDND
jgi:proliferating cell nuclear antigen